ncbi:MAG: serine/threonine-protein kinase, partial [Planctomycetes bacterium]|nr:serine/threonine-protein kinase [Planctomycetota bacterium]
MTSQPTTIGPYEVIREIGRGGMGVVYQARDTRLDREVAIKVLPEAMSRDKERVLRLEREGKLLASLNHSNIAQIYGFEVADKQKFLVLEYVEGETLSQRLKRGPLPVDEAIEVCKQITEALESAHEHGVIHRDLKPGNVMVRPDGTVKVLDFGLARAMTDDSTDAIDANSPTITANFTKPGVVLGTGSYMSPEQARGRPLDKRTDIWSFGVVLYECLTGRMLFRGETATDSMGAVLHKDVDWSLLPADTPSNVRRVLQLCLSRNLRDRLHDIADARIELTETEPTPQGDPTPVHRYRIALGVLGVVALLAILTPLLWSQLGETDGTQGNGSENPLAGSRFSKITDFAGSEFDAAITPDGRFFAFVSDRESPFEMFVGQIDSGGIRNLMRGRDAARLTDDGRIAIRTIGFNGDGSEIWFRDQRNRLRSVPLLGGAVRNLVGENAVAVAWSPDGQRMVYQEKISGDPIYVADPDGAHTRLILGSTDGIHQHHPTWSVDGRWIYFVRGRPPLEMDLWRVRPDGDEAERLTWGNLDVRYPAPIDERTVVYCALDANGAGPWLWAVDVETKSSRRA